MLIGILLKLPLYDRLSHPVCDCRDTQKSLASILFWDFCLSYCLGEIAPACKPVPYRVKVFSRIARYRSDGDTIDTGTFATCSHFFESFPDFPSLDGPSLLFLSRKPLDLDTLIVIYDTSITVHFHSAPLPIPVLNISRLFPDFQSLTLMLKVPNS